MGNFLYHMYSLCTITFWFLLVLWTCHFLCYLLSLWQMSSESEVFIGYADGASWHTQRLASATMVIFTPRGQLLSSGGTCLGDTTNNVIEYSAVIELLRDTLSFGIFHLRVYLDDQLVVSQLNRVYRVHEYTLH